ncbi:MAG: TetR/AcrR family transcriptional regulator [Armatimonadota bacterium]
MISKSVARREREKEKLRKTILSAAREILVTDGYEAISLRTIADMIEYSPGALYLHFKDKDAILQALIEEGFDELAIRLRNVMDPGSLEGLIQKGLNYIQFAVDNPRLYEVMFLARSPEDQEHMRAIADAPPDCFLSLVEAVQAGQRQGTLNCALPEPILAYAIWAQVHGMASIAIARQFFWIPQDQIEILFRESVKATVVGLKV